MEVETQALATFDLNSPFTRTSINHSEISNTELRSSEIDAPEQHGVESPASGGRKCVQGDDQVSVEGGEWEGSLSVGATKKCPKSAATKVQKVYRSYRTRRMLADSAVVAEELWWQAIEYVRLNHSTVSFVDFLKPETAASRWNRAFSNASRVGKGSSVDAKAQMLAFQHWIEAIDPRHRYGHSLHMYYKEWCKSNAGQPFFYWLDLGDGKDVDVEDCPRSKLRQECIKYLGPQERENYEYVAVDGKLLNKKNGKPLDTNKRSPGSKWIFVMSTSKKLYTGEKKKGLFHHSSFLAGGATLAAGRLTAEDGVPKCISPYSGHYKPTDDSLDIFLSVLREKGVNLDEVEIQKANEDYDIHEIEKLAKDQAISEVSSVTDSVQPDLPSEEEKDLSLDAPEPSQAQVKVEFKRTLSGGLQSPRADVPRAAILKRINSKKEAKSYQLGHQISRTWSTGAGPRIGCVADYPVKLRLQALELTNLSPHPSPSSSTPRKSSPLVSPAACAHVSKCDSTSS